MAMGAAGATGLGFDSVAGFGAIEGMAGRAGVAGAAGFTGAAGAAGFSRAGGGLLIVLPGMAGAAGRAGAAILGVAGSLVRALGTGNALTGARDAPLTMTSLRIFFSVDGQIPGTFCKSSTALNGPFFLR